LRRVLTLLWRLLLAFAALVLAYFAVACGLVWWPTEPPQDSGPVVVKAYVYTSGVHTDLVVPVRAQGVDWSLAFPAQHFGEPPRDASFIAIGWGDREFYLDTPRWGE